MPLLLTPSSASVSPSPPPSEMLRQARGRSAMRRGHADASRAVAVRDRRIAVAAARSRHDGAQLIAAARM